MTENERDRRKWFRIDNPIALDYEVLTEAQLKRGVRKMRAGGFPPGGISATLFGMENEVIEKIARVKLKSRETAEALEMLNNKLNALINVMPLLQHDQAGMLEQPLRDGNLSASGIAFDNEEELPKGTPLYLRLVLAPNYFYVESYARVVRCELREKPKDSFPYSVAVEFLAITDAQRELLIRHTMNRETEMLRARRMHA